VCFFHFPLFFSFVRHFPVPTVCISPFTSFSVLLPYSRSYSESFSFSTFSVFFPYSRS
jgi:hypothetical protein